MPILINDNTARVQYTATAGQTVFIVPYEFFETGDLKVYNGDTLLTYNVSPSSASQYSVAGAGVTGGGSITLGAPGATLGSIITIVRDIPIKRVTDFPNAGPFNIQALNAELDKMTAVQQNLETDLDNRVLRLGDSDTPNTLSAIPNKAARQNKLLGFDVQGQPVAYDSASLATLVAYATAFADTFTGDGSNTTFTLSGDPAVIANLDVSINGVTQVPLTDYTLSGTTLTTTTPVPNGAVMLVKYKEGLPNYSGDAQDVRYNAGFTGAVQQSVEAKLEQYVSVKDFGAVGDGVADDTAAIQAALDYVGSVGGGSVFVPAGDYMTTASIQVKSNTTVEFAGWIKPTAVDPYHAAIMGDPAGASNVTLMNPQVDGGGLAPLSGIIIRDDNTEFRVIGGLIKDCQHDTTDKGGRGINIEVGAGSATDPVNITVTGTVIQDCYAGVSCSGGSTQRQSNVSIANLTIENCQSALQFFGNSAGYPHDGGEMQYALTNISARNCGVSTSYTREQGVINSDRGSNITLSNFYVYNDPTYGAVGSLWRGDANNCLISNVTFEGDCNAGLLDFSSYAEANSFPLAANSSLDSDFVTIRQLGTCDETITLPISSASYLQNCRFDLITDTVTSGAPGTAQTANKTNCRMTVYNKTENAFVAGFLSDIGSVTFAEWTDKFYPADSFAARAWGLFDGTNGTMARSFNATSVRNSAGDYTVSFGSTAPVVSYVVTASFAAATASDQVLSIQNKTQNDFDIFTYSGGVATDMPTINFAVYW